MNATATALHGLDRTGVAPMTSFSIRELAITLTALGPAFAPSLRSRPSTSSQGANSEPTPQAGMSSYIPAKSPFFVCDIGRTYAGMPNCKTCPKKDCGGHF